MAKICLLFLSQRFCFSIHQTIKWPCFLKQGLLIQHLDKYNISFNKGWGKLGPCNFKRGSRDWEWRGWGKPPRTEEFSNKLTLNTGFTTKHLSVGQYPSSPNLQMPCYKCQVYIALKALLKRLCNELQLAPSKKYIEVPRPLMLPAAAVCGWWELTHDLDPIPVGVTCP